MYPVSASAKVPSAVAISSAGSGSIPWKVNEYAFISPNAVPVAPDPPDKFAPLLLPT